MDDTDWLIMLGGDGVVTAVEGGAPPSWIRRRIDECSGMPEAVRAAARAFVRGLSRPLSSSGVRRARIAPEAPGSPSFTLLAVEAIPLRPVEVSLDALIRRALQPLTVQADSAHVTLRIETAADLPRRIAIDGEKIAWAATVLVGNALRHVRRGTAAMPGKALRRCFATYLDAVDVPEEQRGRLLGHAKKSVTAKHYTNEQIETDRRAVEFIALRWIPPQGLAGIHFSEVRVFHRRGIARHLGAWMRRRGRARPGHDDVRRDAQVARTDLPHAPGPRAAHRASEMSLVGAGSLAERGYAPSSCGAWLSKLNASPVNSATLVTFSRPRTRNWPRPSRLLK